MSLGLENGTFGLPEGTSQSQMGKDDLKMGGAEKRRKIFVQKGVHCQIVKGRQAQDWAKSPSSV